MGDQLGIANVLNGLGFIERRWENWKAAPGLFEKALKIGYEMGNKHVIAAALEGLGLMAHRQGHWQEARHLFEQFLAIERELNNITQIALALFRLGYTALAQGDIAIACARYEESLSLYRELNFEQFIASVLNAFGEVARYQGDYEKASTFYSESLSLYQEQGLGSEHVYLMVLMNMAYVAYHQGDYLRARELFLENFLLGQKLKDYEASALCLIGIAGILTSQQKPQKAVSLISAARASLDPTATLTIDVLLSPADQVEYRYNLEKTKTQLDTVAFKAAWTKGWSMSLEQAMAYALDGDADSLRSVDG